jgi:hypothetical protein
MPIVVFGPIVQQDEDGLEAVQLQITVQNGDEARQLFDQIEVWRSTTSASGPYEELTDDSWSAARVPKTAKDEPASPVTGASTVLVGLDLDLRINEKAADDITVTFTGADPLTFADAATQIIAQGQNKVTSYVDEDGVLVVETTQTGNGSTLRVLESDAAAILGLPTDDVQGFAFGREARISLSQGKEVYPFVDNRGSGSYFYRTRFRNQLNATFSEFSPSFSADQALGISASNIVCGRLDLVSLDGKPLRSVEVTIYNSYHFNLVEDRLVTEGQQSRTTDNDGHVEFSLVRGTRVTVAISGTSIVRDIVVPTDPELSVFPLLGPEAAAGDDVFKVQVPVLIAAERRSL